MKVSLNFFRDFFRIPKRVRLAWCILVERGEGGYEQVRLGVRLRGTDKAIDVALREFVQLNLPTQISYTAVPAERKADGDEFVFTGAQYEVRVPVTYVSDIYYRSVYSDALVEDTIV